MIKYTVRPIKWLKNVSPMEEEYAYSNKLIAFSVFRFKNKPTDQYWSSWRYHSYSHNQGFVNIECESPEEGKLLAQKAIEEHLSPFLEKCK